MKSTSVSPRIRGFSLVELMIVLVVIAIFAGLIIGRGKSGKAEASAQQEGQMSVDLFNGMLSMKSGGTYGTAGTDLAPTMISKGRVPSSYSTSGTTVLNTYNGSVTWASAGGTATMTQNGLPQEACVAVVHSVSALGQSTIKANGTSLGSSMVADSDATSACNKSGLTNVVTIQSLM